jgi:protein-S-isoprenylcysteine O-methyltransferase Ste14
MLTGFYTNPLFWMGLHLVGYVITIVVLTLPRVSNSVENKIPKPLTRIFILLTFIAPPVILPFTKGPKIAISTPIALTAGILLLVINFAIKIVAQRQIGVSPALKSKEKLIMTGIYGTVRHPLYLSNGLLAIGLAILLKSTFALLFSITYTLLYLQIIHLEERNLSEI